MCDVFPQQKPLNTLRVLLLQMLQMVRRGERSLVIKVQALWQMSRPGLAPELRWGYAQALYRLAQTSIRDLEELLPFSYHFPGRLPINPQDPDGPEYQGFLDGDVIVIFKYDGSRVTVLSLEEYVTDLEFVTDDI